MKQMFPEITIANNGNNFNVNNSNVSVGNDKNKNYFTNEEIYKYSRPDSIINLKPKKK